MAQQILFFFSALGAFNGLIVGLYFLFFIKHKHVSNFFFGSLIVVLSLRVGKSVFYYFTDSLPDFYILFGLLACWLIGPFLYFYITSAIANIEGVKAKAWRIFIPLVAIAIMVMILYPWSAYIDLWKNQLVKAIYLQWLFFVILAGLQIFRYRNRVFFDSKNNDFKIWLASVYLGNLLICTVFNSHAFTPYIVGALSFSFVFYVLTLLLLFHKKRERLLFLESNKYRKNRITASEAQEIQEHIQALIENEKMYLDADLSIAKLSKVAQVSTVKLSQTFNEFLDMSFNDYINSYRIAEAKKTIANCNTLTLEAIGMDCGFNSKSTFYSAFKRHTGMTPSQFRKHHL